MVNKSFWKKICVQTDEVDKRISEKKNLYKIDFLNLSNESYEELAEFFEVQINDNMSIDEKINVFMSSNKFKIFAYLDEFSKRKKNYLKILFQKEKFKLLLKADDYKIPQMRLIRLFENNPENLIEALLFCEFIKKKGKEVYTTDPPWSDELSDLFKEKMPYLKGFIRRKYKRKFELIKSFKDEDSEYYAFHREKNKTIKEGFNLKNVDLTKKSDLFIFVDKRKNHFEFRCLDSKLKRLVREFINRNLDVNFFSLIKEKKESNLLQKVKKTLIERPDEITEDIYIDRVYLKRAGVNPKVSFIIGKKNGVDIRNNLKTLYQDNLVQLDDLKDISSFNININGKSYNIKIRETKEGSVILKHELENEELVAKKLKENFNLTINKPLVDYGIDKDLSLWFKRFLDYNGGYNLKHYQKQLLSDMFEEKLIKLNKKTIWQCKENHRHIFHKKYSDCPECGANLRILEKYEQTSPNYKGIFNFVKNKFKEIYGNSNVKESSRTYWGKKYRLIHVSGDINFYIYIDDRKNLKKLCSCFKRSLLPVVFVVLNKKPKGMIEEDIFPIINLKELFLEDSNLLVKEINLLKTNYHSRLDRASITSFNKLKDFLSGKDIEYGKDDLEDDTFNLMKYIFETGEKWGKEKNRRRLPEAVLGYSTYYKKRKRGFKSGKISLIWDAKFRRVEGTYDFNQEQKDKATRYIQYACQSKAIKDFSGTLNGYITFCNSVNLTQYKHFSEFLYNYVTFKGSVILFDLNALINLYTFIRENEDLFRNKKQVFLNQFSKLIERKNDKFIHINNKKIDGIIKFIKETKRDSSIDTESLREHFELGKLY